MKIPGGYLHKTKTTIGSPLQEVGLELSLEELVGARKTGRPVPEKLTKSGTGFFRDRNRGYCHERAPGAR